MDDRDEEDDLDEEADEVAHIVWRFFNRSRREVSAHDNFTSSNLASSKDMGESKDFDLQGKKIAVVLLGDPSSATSFGSIECCG